uniref:Uncharacterized protein n=1 Tax=Geladintestivirus 2 TaxID=3233134 RepID=A0AAU8MJW8_9CAUD
MNTIKDAKIINNSITITLDNDEEIVMQVSDLLNIIGRLDKSLDAYLLILIKSIADNIIIDILTDSKISIKDNNIVEFELSTDSKEDIDTVVNDYKKLI